MKNPEIFEVHKDEKNVITHVKVRMESGINMPDRIITKQEAILDMQYFRAAYVVPSGAIIRVVDGRYLRSDANDIKEDNLGELPTF